MPITIITLLAFGGPNIVGPQPAVFLRVRSAQNDSRRLTTIIKEAAQRVGLVIGYLDADAAQDAEGWLITVRFATPLPGIGREVAAFAVDEARARALGDEEWDRETPLYELGRRRRREMAPLPLLQLEAEAIRRDLPLLRRPDGLWQAGTGAHGWSFDPAQPAAPPWEQLGRVPVIMFAGGAARLAALGLVEAAFRHAAPHVRVAHDLQAESATTLLADPHLEQLFAGVTVQTLATAGLPCDRCYISAILDLEGVPTHGLTKQEWAQALGVPMLATDQQEGFAIINGDDPQVAALADYAPCRVLFVCTGPGSAAVAAHRAGGGAALVVRDGTVLLAAGDDEQPLGPLPATNGPELLGLLAGGIYLLGLRGYGIDVPLPWEHSGQLRM